MEGRGAQGRPREAPLRKQGDEKSSFFGKMGPKAWILEAMLDPKSVKIDAKINAKIDAEKVSTNDAKMIQK